ncbi:nucleoside ABC transporter ATP-binding protein [Rhizobium sp. PP-F2F-G48]|uniref:ABC transporter ATP-binding protein n=1 Tax=Rhizobium sp. PP-F2F-G48 TaxID=2135651 RepID=UPI0010E1B4CD|nr:ABC transporter ATP-binding protein [Rhizobium sp. PP-F2F-G48]TCM52771.1 nucleoside ABC transporter ATP-binding protein [Rhizobium sp. PP-F2F-G48]
MTHPILELERVSKTFDGFRALDGASFSAAAGEIHALLGENGAGKSTLMNICCGLYTPDGGSLRLEGRETYLSGPREAAALGIGMVHQHFKLVRPFTVLDNVLLSRLGAVDRIASAKSERRTVMAAIQKQAAALGAALDPDARIDSLSIAEQQRVEVVKALIGGARILILDEPTAVLTDQEAEKLMLTLRRLAESGTTIVLVTHKLSDVKRFADRVTILRGGRTVASVNPKETTLEELTRLTVGEALPSLRDVQPVFGRRRLETLSLSVQRANGTKAVDAVSFHVRAGEIYAVAGVSGNGQSELTELLMGLRRADSGTVQFEDAGEAVSAADPARLRQFGVAFIPADRYRYALAGGLSVAENYGIGNVVRGLYGSWLWLKRGRLRADAEEALSTFDVQGVRNLSQNAALLSGGNAQKLVIAREFSDPPSIIVAQSPSRGLDARATAAVHARLQEAAGNGAAVLLVSEDLDEAMKLAHRIGVMAGGKLIAEFTAPFDRQAIGAAMVGHD